MNHGEVGIFFGSRLDRRQAHEMFPTDEKRELPVRQDFRGKISNHTERTRRIPEGQLQIAAVEHARILKVKILIRTIRLQSIGFGAHRPRGKARAGTIRGRRVERRAKEDNVPLLIRGVTS